MENNLENEFEKGAMTVRNMVKESFDKRYKELINKLDNEINIGKKYELKVQIEELVNIYNILKRELGF